MFKNLCQQGVEGITMETINAVLAPTDIKKAIMETYKLLNETDLDSISSFQGN